MISWVNLILFLKSVQIKLNLIVFFEWEFLINFCWFWLQWDFELGNKWQSRVHVKIPGIINRNFLFAKLARH